MYNMASEHTEEGALESWYRNRIGRPATGDEVRGYWVFVVGVVLGVAGLLAFLASDSASGLREAAIALSAAGLALVFAGPVIRLPLRRRANTLVYLGLVLCGAAIVWFSTVFPNDWLVATGEPRIIGLYALGLLLIGAAGVLIPIVASREENERLRTSLAAEVETLRGTLAASEAEEESLQDVVSELREAIADAEADENDIAAVVERLRGEVADTQADEADLAAQLESLRTSSARFELYEDNGGEYRWRLRHRNGNIIATGGEGYTRRHNAQKGLQSVRRNALGATVLHVEPEALPEEGEEFEPVAEVESDATFELYEDNAGEFRFRLRHGNGNVIGDSGEGYASERNARRALDRLQEYVGAAEYLRFDPTGVELYRDNEGKWRWRLVHRNGNILADSGEGYSRRRNARRAVDGIKSGLDDLSFETYEDNAGEFRWRLRSGNREIMADSGEGYSDESGAEEAVERVREYLPDADVLDIGPAAFEIFEDKGGEFRWRLRHRNGNILADSGEGYAERRNVRDAIESVKRNAPNAAVETQ